MNETEKKAILERQITEVEIAVVNWRTDIIPFYKKRGFVETKKIDFNLICDPGHASNRESYFIFMRKPAI